MDAVSDGYVRTDYSRLIGRAKFAAIATLITIGLFVGTLLGEVAEFMGFIDLEAIEIGLLGWAYISVSLGGFVAFLVSVVAIGLWIYRAHATLREAGRSDLEFSPGWAVGWYFIPFANLVMPFKAMRELWSESHMAQDSYGSEAPSRLGAWWACWIIGNIAGNISLRMSLAQDADLLQAGLLVAIVSSVFTIAAAYFIWKIIGEITHALATNVSAVSVFE